jgi:hypothetical protein
MSIIQKFVYAKKEVDQLLFPLSRLDCDYPNANVVVLVYKPTGIQTSEGYQYKYKGAILQ